MPRYIDADALIDDIRKHSESYFADDFAHEWVDKQPSADVQPVRHGHWDETTEPCGWTDEDCAECSECHNTFVLGDYTMEDIRESFKYCPNCGARMDGE